MNFETKANEIYHAQNSNVEKLKLLEVLLTRIDKDKASKINNSSNVDLKVASERCQYLINELQNQISGTESEENRVKRKITKDENNHSPEIKKMVEVSKTTKK